MIAPILWLLVPLVFGTDTYNHQGCYKASDLQSSLSSQGEYEYQSVSYCEEECDGKAVAGLTSGSTCYCGDSVSVLSGLSTVDDSNCDTACNGWPYQNCGGSGYIDVYVLAGDSVSSASSSGSGSSGSSSASSSSNSGSSTASSSSESSSSSASSSQASSSAAASSSSTTSSSSSSSSSSKASSSTSSTSASSSSTSSSSTSSSSSSSSTSASSSSLPYSTVVVTSSLSVVTLSNDGRSTVFVTATTVVTSSATSASSDKTTTSKKSSLSGGTIAGIVVGVVVGSLLLAALLFFLIWRHRRNQGLDLEETKQHQPYSFGHNDVAPVPVSQIDNSLHSTGTDADPILEDDLLRPSPVFEDNYGRIRLSNGSLPDVTQEHKPLRIVNPDSDDPTDEDRY